MCGRRGEVKHHPVSSHSLGLRLFWSSGLSLLIHVHVCIESGIKEERKVKESPLTRFSVVEVIKI
jgi:hypothetical protein